MSEHPYTSFGAGDSARPGHVLVTRWWPLLALLIAVAFVLIGAILFSP